MMHFKRSDDFADREARVFKQNEQTLLAEPGASACGHMEIWAGPTGRRSWPNDLKARLVLESFQPGARVTEIARRNGLAPQHLSKWRRLAREGRLALPSASAEPAFAAIAIEETQGCAAAKLSDKTEPPAPIEILFGAATIRLPHNASPERVAAIIAALRASE